MPLVSCDWCVSWESSRSRNHSVGFGGGGRPRRARGWWSSSRGAFSVRLARYSTTSRSWEFVNRAVDFRHAAGHLRVSRCWSSSLRPVCCRCCAASACRRIRSRRFRRRTAGFQRHDDGVEARGDFRVGFDDGFEEVFAALPGADVGEVRTGVAPVGAGAVAADAREHRLGLEDAFVRASLSPPARATRNGASGSALLVRAASRVARRGSIWGLFAAGTVAALINSSWTAGTFRWPARRAARSALPASGAGGTERTKGRLLFVSGARCHEVGEDRRDGVRRDS